jgi:hypothetical protein
MPWSAVWALQAAVWKVAYRMLQPANALRKGDAGDRAEACRVERCTSHQSTRPGDHMHDDDDMQRRDAAASLICCCCCCCCCCAAYAVVPNHAGLDRPSNSAPLSSSRKNVVKSSVLVRRQNRCQPGGCKCHFAMDRDFLMDKGLLDGQGAILQILRCVGSEQTSASSCR